MSRSPHSVRTSAAIFLVATLALLLAPLATAWEHLQHEPTATATGHAECEAWTIASGHEANHAGQFEASEAARHEHHGLCQVLTSLSGAPLESASSAYLGATGTECVDAFVLPRGLDTSHPPSRGPPSRV